MKIRKLAIDLIQILIGVTLMACGVSLFLLPNQLSSGGFTGIATILYYLFKFPLGTTILILNIPLFVFALFKIGRKYVIKSIVGTALLSVAIDIADKFEPLTNDKFLACIYGGILVGIGLSFVFKGEASTGGTDIIATLMTKFKPGLRMSEIIMIVDIIIISLNVIVFREIEVGLYSAIAIFLVSKMLDIFLEGFNFAKMIIIISDKSNEISENIHARLQRGTTGLYGKGMYTEEEKTVILCVTGRRELIKIKQISKEIDKDCFVIVTNAREVLGEGFE